jgi:uncharacterized membrane protein
MWILTKAKTHMEIHWNSITMFLYFTQKVIEGATGGSEIFTILLVIIKLIRNNSIFLYF